MVNEMAAKQLNVNPDEVLNTSILDLLSLGDDYDLRSLITEVPELTIDSQDENGEYISLRVRCAWFVASQVYLSGLVAVLHDTTEQDKGRAERHPLFPMWVMNYGHRWPVWNPIWKPLTMALCQSR